MDRYQMNTAYNIANKNNSTILSKGIQAENKTDSGEEPGNDIWPAWATTVQCISHFLLTFYSSVTFLIYYAKQKSYTTQST